MPSSRFLSPLILCIFALVTGCSGSGRIVTPPAQNSAVSLTMIDAPPAGVTALSFQVNVIGATLQPGNIDLLGGKTVQIEVKRLEVETGSVSTANVPASAGPFTSLNLVFSNPALTFQNNSGNLITVGSKACAIGQVCELNPAGTLNVTVNFNPLLSLTPGNKIGLKVDLKLDQLLTSPTPTSVGVDFTTAGAVTVAQSQIKAQGELEDVDDVFGTVQNKNTSVTPNTFDLATSTGNTLNGIQLTSNTQLEVPSACSPVTFANCINNGDRVEVDLLLMPGGVLAANRIEKENEVANEQELEGVVFAVPPTTTASTFQMVAVENASSLPVSFLGMPVTISVPNGTNFQVDTDGLSLSSTQQVLTNAFTSGGIASLQVGQNIQAKLATDVSGAVVGNGTAANPFVANRVRLRMSRFTGTVATPQTNGVFNVDPLPGTLLAGTRVQVQTSSQTKFEGVTDVTGLNVNDKVSLRGLLFNGPPVTLVAGKVRRKP